MWVLIFIISFSFIFFYFNLHLYSLILIFFIFSILYLLISSSSLPPLPSLSRSHHPLFNKHPTINSLNIIDPIDIDPEELPLDQLIDKGVLAVAAGLLALGLPAFGHVPFNLLHQDLGNRVRVAAVETLLLDIRVLPLGLATVLLDAGRVHETLSDQLDYLLVWKVVQQLLLVVLGQIAY